jgi:hypothetical protein
LFDLMYSHIFLIISVLGSGSVPTTLPNSASTVRGAIKAGFPFPPPLPDALLPDFAAAFFGALAATFVAPLAGVFVAACLIDFVAAFLAAFAIVFNLKVSDINPSVIPFAPTLLGASGH